MPYRRARKQRLLNLKQDTLGVVLDIRCIPLRRTRASRANSGIQRISRSFTYYVIRGGLFSNDVIRGGVFSNDWRRDDWLLITKSIF